MRLERIRERLRSKLRPLDFRCAVAGNGLFHRFDAEGGVERVREPVANALRLCQSITATS